MVQALSDGNIHPSTEKMALNNLSGAISKFPCESEHFS